MFFDSGSFICVKNVSEIVQFDEVTFKCPVEMTTQDSETLPT